MRQVIVALAVSLACCLAANLRSSEEQLAISERELAKLNSEELEVAKHWKDILASKRELARDQSNHEVAKRWEEALEERELEGYLEGEELQMERRGQSCIVGDVIFVLDSSGSIKIENWKFVLDFVNTAISKMNVGPTATRVGVETFGNRAHLIFNLNNFTTADQMYPAVSAAKFLDENTNTSGALWLAMKVMLTPANGARPDAPDIIIVITDGVSTYDHELTLPYAQQGKASGITIISIGVGNETSLDELNGMASTGGDGKPLVFQVGGYSMLTQIQERLATVACDPVATQGPTAAPVTAAPPAPQAQCDPHVTTPLPDCPAVSCKNRCQYGFQQDATGCLSSSCACLPTPPPCVTAAPKIE